MEVVADKTEDEAAAEPQQIRSLPKEPRWWTSSLLTTALSPRVPDHLGRLLGLCPLGEPVEGVVLLPLCVCRHLRALHTCSAGSVLYILCDPVEGVVLFQFVSAEIFEPYISAMPGLLFRAQFFSTQTLGVGDVFLCQALLHDAYVGGGPRP